MPQFNYSASVAAGATALPLSNWQFRFPPKSSLLEILANASAAGLVMNLTTGAESIVQAESAVSGGGTAGTLPSRLGTEPIVDKVDAGEEIVLTVRNPTAGAITLNMVAVLTYGG